MSREQTKAMVQAFRRQYSIRTVTCSGLRSALEQMGYTVATFLPAGNTSAVDTVIRTLGLQEAVRTAKAFTYADQNYRIVFVRKDLTEKEQLVLLAHETGHIVLGHMNCGVVLGRDVTEEFEANEFSHYLLHEGPWTRFRASFQRHRKRYIACAAVLLLLMIGAAAARTIYLRQVYYGNYYVTDNGTRYHKKSCIKLRKSTNVHRLTIAEYESGKYEPCQVCLPDED